MQLRFGLYNHVLELFTYICVKYFYRSRPIRKELVHTFHGLKFKQLQLLESILQINFCDNFLTKQNLVQFKLAIVALRGF
jgi:hypothetical protein